MPTPEEQLLRSQQQANAIINSDNERAIADYNMQTAAEVNALDQNAQAQEANYKTYSDIVKGWADEARINEENARKAAEEQAKSDRKQIQNAGLAQAASAIVNLIGTAHGAQNQPAVDNMDKWQSRADAARREREAKTEGYRAQLRNLETQKAQLDYQFGNTKAQADLNRANVLANRAQGLNQMLTSAAQTKAKGALDLAQLGYNIDRQRKQDAQNEEKQITALRRGGYDPISGKYYNPKTGNFDSDTFVSVPASSRSGGGKAFSDYTATDWRGFRDKYAQGSGLKNGYKDYLALKKDDKKYREWAEANPEYAEIMSLLEDTTELTDDNLKHLELSQSVVNALNGEFATADGKKATIINPAEAVPSNKLAMNLDKDGNPHYVGFAGAVQDYNKKLAKEGAAIELP